MSEPVDLIFGVEIPPDDLLALVERLGGVREESALFPARLSDGSRHVWVAAVDTDFKESEPEDLQRAAEALGAHPRSHVILELNRQPGSGRLALRLAVEAGRLWPLVLDDLLPRGRVYTHSELVALYEAGRELGDGDGD